MLAMVQFCAVVGLDGALVRVEVDLANNLPAFTIVGLPDAAVNEAKERVRAAIRNSGLTFPMKRITVNLAPADLRKEGPAYDLPMAVGILPAGEQVVFDDAGCLRVAYAVVSPSARLTPRIISDNVWGRTNPFLRPPTTNSRGTVVKRSHIRMLPGLMPASLNSLPVSTIRVGPAGDPVMTGTTITNRSRL